MNNLCDEQVIQDNNYTNTYSLWGNSKYYDIKNLSPQNYCVNLSNPTASETSQEFRTSRWTSSPSEGKAPEPPDSRNRRIVDRDSLYDDPECFHKNNIEDLPPESPCKSPTTPTPPTNEWTQDYWHKATEKVEDTSTGSGKYRKQAFGLNKIQKKLDKMLAKPVKMTKAESMMQKMGWQGGALGRSGDGIVEPIAPNAVYAKKKVGFGQHLQLLKPIKTKKADSKQFFEMNVLLNIYEFVKNNSEVELLFDRKLKKEERKRIHNIVQFKLKADDLAMVDFDSTAHMDLVLQISDKNCYILQTQSSGVHPYRQLCLYKEAPPHVYLLIPDDLKDEDEEAPFTFRRDVKQNDLEKNDPNSEEEDIQPKMENIHVIQPQIDVIQPKVEAIQPKVEAIQPKVEAIQPKVEAIQPKVEAIQPKVEAIHFVQPKVVVIQPKMVEAHLPIEEKGKGIVEKIEMEPELEIEEETNPFLRSITRNLKKPKIDLDGTENSGNTTKMETSPIPEAEKNPDNSLEKKLELSSEMDSKKTEILKSPLEEKPQSPNLILPPMSEILARIVDYFLEFAADKNYTQFKFLGPFTDEEISAINEFLEEAMKYLSNEAESQLAAVFDKVAFDINDDCSGNTVIYKRILAKKHRKKKSRKDSKSSSSQGSPKKMAVDDTLAV